MLLSLKAPIPLRGAEKAACTRHRPHHSSSKQLVSHAKTKYVALQCHLVSSHLTAMFSTLF